MTHMRFTLRNAEMWLRNSSTLQSIWTIPINFVACVIEHTHTLNRRRHTHKISVQTTTHTNSIGNVFMCTRATHSQHFRINVKLLMPIFFCLFRWPGLVQLMVIIVSAIHVMMMLMVLLFSRSTLAICKRNHSPLFVHIEWFIDCPASHVDSRDVRTNKQMRRLSLNNK